MTSITSAFRDIKGLSTVAQEACNLFLSECKNKGVNIFITETYRSPERQAYLYEQGRSRPGSIITWTRNSNHTSRMAWDIAVSPPHNLYDSAVLAKAGEIATSLGIEWGGNWQTPDTPHFEVSSDWKPPKEVYQVRKTKIILNGSIKKVDAIMHSGHYYVKLRDLADDNIIVAYDNTKKLPIIEILKATLQNK